MKSNSDNSRSSAILDIIDILEENNVNIIIYEPTINKNDFDAFIKKSDLIIANRIDEKLLPYKDKVYTRDLFFNN
jgi:UDPglucose 6-dehydrogenase